MRFLLAGVMACSFARVSWAAGDGWNDTITPQIELHHESAFLPAGLSMSLGSVYGRLKMDLSMFAPWMSKERIKIYLYHGRAGYLRGDFDPPSWSNGVAFSDRRLVASYEQSDTQKTIEILSHEMTHVLFESYWAEVKKEPPVWLNEGLAMLEESQDPSQPEKSDWFQAMAVLASGRKIPFKNVVHIRPTRDMKHVDRNAVTLWYVQAYSMVYFLYRRHSRLQFFNFVRSLRDGQPLEKALWQVYRYNGLSRFEEAWMDWLRLPSTRSKFDPSRFQGRASASVSPERAGGRSRKRSGGLRPVRFSDFHFDSLLPDK